MLVYGHHSFPLNVPAFLQRFRDRLGSLPATPDHDRLVDLLVDFGEAYAAVADAAMPREDDDPAELTAWTATLSDIADAVAASWARDGPEVRAALDRARRTATALPRPPTDDVSAKTAEGFAHYAVYPEQYLVAAERFVERDRPRALLAVGIRSIGAPLACIVAAAARRAGVPAQVITVRPRGHPFDRRLELSDRLRLHIRALNPSHIAVVDEGPGLSGSSFAAVCDALSGGSARIAIFPSWQAPEKAMRSRRGQDAWRRHPKEVAAFEDVWPTADYEDLSAGAWRVRAGVWPAVHPQHERRKYLRAASECRGPAVQLKFAGLGRYGRAKLERAQLLASAGFTPRPVDLTRGFLTEEWIEGEPLRAGSTVPSTTIERLASYLAFLRRTCATGARARTDDLTDDELGVTAPPFDEPEVAVDGRMLPHEWIASAHGLLKTDALDHHADDFLPCSRDIAWDLAGTIVEFRLDAEVAHHLISCYEQSIRDATIALRVPCYCAAYLAYRFRYTTMAAETLGKSPDGLRFRQAASRYRRLLEALASPRRRDRRC